MKTRNNTQKTVKDQLNKMTLQSPLVIFSLVAVSLTVNAGDFRSQILNHNRSGEIAIVMPEQGPGFEKSDTVFEASNTQHANWENKPAVIFSVESEVGQELQAKTLMTNEIFLQWAERFTADGADREIGKYAQKLIARQESSHRNKTGNQAIDGFSDGFKPLEAEAWMTNENFLQSAEKLTADGSDREIEKYTEKIIAQLGTNTNK